MDKKHLTWALGLYLVLIVAVFAAPRLALPTQSADIEVGAAAIRERIAFDAKDDSYTYNGADIKMYSDNHSTAKIYLMGDSGNVGIGGTLVVTGATTHIGAVTYSGGIAYAGALAANTVNATDNITVGQNLRVVGTSILTGNVNIPGILSSDTIDILRLNDNTLVTGTLGVSGKATLATADVTGAAQFGSTGLFNGAVTANAAVITTTLVGSGAASFGSTGLFNGAVTMSSGVVTGTLGVAGVGTFSSQLQADNGLRVTQNITQVSGSFILNSGTVSSTLGVAGVGTFSSQLYADNGLRVTQNITQTSGTAYLNAVAVTSTLSANTLSVTDNVTVTNDLTVTGFVGLGGTYMAVSSTVDYTNTETLVVVRDKTIYPVTSGGPTATLNDTTSISDGFYLGQIIIITNVDAQDHAVIIKNNANTKMGMDLTLDGIAGAASESAMMWWDGADWRTLAYY